MKQVQNYKKALRNQESDNGAIETEGEFYKWCCDKKVDTLDQWNAISKSDENKLIVIKVVYVNTTESGVNKQVPFCMFSTKMQLICFFNEYMARNSEGMAGCADSTFNLCDNGWPLLIVGSDHCYNGQYEVHSHNPWIYGFGRTEPAEVWEHMFRGLTFVLETFFPLEYASRGKIKMLCMTIDHCEAEA